MIYTFKFQDQIYRINLEDGKQTEVEIDGKKFPVCFQKIDERFYSILIDGESIGVGILKKGKKVEVFLNGELYEFESISERERQSTSAIISGVQQIKSPMPSRVVKILKNVDEAVNEGEGVIVIEAMKMESELKSPINGRVKEVKVKEGSAVESGSVLIVISSE
ncbi:MAG: biotin/lipoyl-binding protein [Deltaproteobacteria bacterium]|nr:biotin/lipoyl-binding protein [Deltaproteobacteria bacterium]